MNQFPLHYENSPTIWAQLAAEYLETYWKYNLRKTAYEKLTWKQTVWANSTQKQEHASVLGTPYHSSWTLWEKNKPIKKYTKSWNYAYRIYGDENDSWVNRNYLNTYVYAYVHIQTFIAPYSVRLRSQLDVLSYMYICLSKNLHIHLDSYIIGLVRPFAKIFNQCD